MSVRRALTAALGDLYRHSWRLLPVNAALGAAFVGILVVAAHRPFVLAAVVLLGPLAAALIHCAVTLARDDDLRLADALEGLRLHWRRGLVLAAVAAILTLAVGRAVAFYGGSQPLLWPLSFLVLYVALALGVHQLLLWTLAIADPGVPLREAAVRALELVLRRPLASLALGVVAVLVNLAGVVAALMPFLTLTVAYTFLAAAHFVLTPADEEVS